MISLVAPHMALTTTKKKVYANRLLDQEEYFIYMYISQFIWEYRQTCTRLFAVKSKGLTMKHDKLIMQVKRLFLL